MPVALRPLNTSLIRATLETGGTTLTFEGVDADLLASRVFSCIDSMSAEWRPIIAANFVEALASWTGDAGTDDELEEAKSELVAQLSSSLASAYASAVPVRRVPRPPVVTVTTESFPLAQPPSLADARKWVLRWEVRSPDEAAGDLVRTELIESPIAPPSPVEATPFERALLAFDASPDAANLEALAMTPVAAATAGAPPIPSGPASGSAVLDVLDPPVGIRAVVVRNHGYPDSFLYAADWSSEILAPLVVRDEELVVEALDEIAALSPSRVEVWFESREPRTRVPVVLVIDQFDGSLVEQAMVRWREMTAPPDGEFIFDVTAARLRLQRVVVRKS